MRLVVIPPHFEPDVAPTGDVATRIVHELGRRKHTIEVVTSFPWYRHHRIEPGYGGRLVRHEDTPWGRITRLHPFPTANKRNLVRRAAAYASFSGLAAAHGARGGPVDGVLAMSPPLTLGLTGGAVASARRAPFVFNIQDVFPDVAVELGVITDRRIISAARRLERFCYERADAITVLSEDLRANVAAKTGRPDKIRVIPNFVDTDAVVPTDKDNAYRREFGLDGKTIVMYAGNVGLSQSLEIMLDAAGALSYEEDLVFVINGDGAARDELERKARDLSNVRFVDMQPLERVAEVYSAADVHVVPLKKGLARSSVPSKTYSILAAARPLIASVDEGSEVARIVERAGAGVAVPPEDSEAFTKVLRKLLDAPNELTRMGAAGRRFVETWASPAAVASAYETLFEELRR
ncbi:MAG: glycosyltransferase family 4 protein [Actinomycetota bacterium]|nr:glycosyltransferase family 4 protein [Actinomycetota bacterium]